MIVKQNEKGEQVGEPYISVRQAAKEMGVDHTSILRAIDKQFLFDGKKEWHVSRDNGIDCSLDPNTICEGKPKGNDATVDDIVRASGEECFHKLSSRVELERL